MTIERARPGARSLSADQVRVNAGRAFNSLSQHDEPLFAWTRTTMKPTASVAHRRVRAPQRHSGHSGQNTGSKDCHSSDPRVVVASSPTLAYQRLFRWLRSASRRDTIRQPNYRGALPRKGCDIRMMAKSWRAWGRWSKSRDRRAVPSRRRCPLL